MKNQSQKYSNLSSTDTPLSLMLENLLQNHKILFWSGLIGVIVLLMLIPYGITRFAKKPRNVNATAAVEQKSANINVANSSTNQQALKTETASNTNVNSVPSSPDSTDTTPEIQKAMISKGEQIYKRIESKTKLPIMFGWRAENITLMIPTKDWDSLSKTEQVNLAYYAQNLTSVIRAKPKSYVDSWTKYYKVIEQLEDGGETDGLTYGSYMSQATILCGNCWSIAVGKLKGRGFYEDTTPVSGSTFAEFQK